LIKRIHFLQCTFDLTIISQMFDMIYDLENELAQKKNEAYEMLTKTFLSAKCDN